MRYRTVVRRSSTASAGSPERWLRPVAIVAAVSALVIPTLRSPLAGTVDIGGQSVRFPGIAESVGGY
jgi:hypothetical protein